MTGYRATVLDCPSWAQCLRVRTPALRRSLTPRPRTSSRRIFPRRTSRCRITRVRTRTHTSVTRTLWTPYTSHSSTRGAPVSDRTWVRKAELYCRSLEPRYRSSPVWTPGGITRACAGRMCCSTPHTMGSKRGWVTVCPCMAWHTAWRMCRLVKSLFVC